MNTTSAKAVIEKWMGMLATGDMEAIAAMFTDDAVIDMPGTSDLPWAGRWRGRAKIDEYFKVLPAALEIREALIEAHAPGDEAALDPLAPARLRLAYDELLANQLALLLVRAHQRNLPGRAIAGDGALGGKALAALPFTLTGAQGRALDEIAADISPEL